MAVREILLLGNPKLYEPCKAVQESECATLAGVVSDLRDTLFDFRERYRAGRAIAAPQIGCMKRVVYMNIDGQETVFVNPMLSKQSEELIELWDDCMSFPELLVKVQRHRKCVVSYRDLGWTERSMVLEDDLSELLQHECDHLDGVLAVSRAIDGNSFCLRSQRQYYEEH